MDHTAPNDDLAEYWRRHSDEAACTRHRKPHGHSKPNTYDKSCHKLDENVDVLNVIAPLLSLLSFVHRLPDVYSVCGIQQLVQSRMLP